MGAIGDLQLAFELQMQEVMKASLSQAGCNVGSSSNYESRSIRNDLDRKIHDQAFARKMLDVPEKQWKETEDDITRPSNDGPAVPRRSVNTANRIRFLMKGLMSKKEPQSRVYVKGLTSEEVVGDRKRKILFAGIGVAVCDMNDRLIREVSKGVVEGGSTVDAVEAKALIEALNVIMKLGLKRIVIVCDCVFLYQCITGKWRPMESNLATLVDQVSAFQRKLTSCAVSLVEGKQVKFAFELASNAIISQKKLIETCAICLENVYENEMFSIDGCSHRYCRSCMEKHVKVKLLQGQLPECPHEGCKSMLKPDGCKKLLTPDLFDTMSQRFIEASIPLAEKIYCPYPTCSALMSRAEIQSTSGRKVLIIAGTCKKCHRCFCVNCRVPWHDNMTCEVYKQLRPYLCPEETMLKSLATNHLWRQCVKCNHMVSLASGCNHIYCRCGHQFCYACGAEWKNKKACSCPVWDERMIIHNRHQQGRG